MAPARQRESAFVATVISSFDLVVVHGTLLARHRLDYGLRYRRLRRVGRESRCFRRRKMLRRAGKVVLGGSGREDSAGRQYIHRSSLITVIRRSGGRVALARREGKSRNARTQAERYVTAARGRTFFYRYSSGTPPRDTLISSLRTPQKPSRSSFCFRVRVGAAQPPNDGRAAHRAAGCTPPPATPGRRALETGRARPGRVLRARGDARIPQRLPRFAGA